MRVDKEIKITVVCDRKETFQFNKEVIEKEVIFDDIEYIVFQRKEKGVYGFVEFLYGIKFKYESEPFVISVNTDSDIVKCKASLQKYKIALELMNR